VDRSEKARDRNCYLLAAVVPVVAVDVAIANVAVVGFEL